VPHPSKEQKCTTVFLHPNGLETNTALIRRWQNSYVLITLWHTAGANLAKSTYNHQRKCNRENIRRIVVSVLRYLVPKIAMGSLHTLSLCYNLKFRIRIQKLHQKALVRRLRGAQGLPDFLRLLLHSCPPETKG
jgi:hypothetical protein